MDIVLIGKRIREYTEAKNLTQAALAELADISERTLSDIENGKVTPKCENLVNISRVLCEPLADIVMGLNELRENSLYDRITQSIADFTDEDLQCLIRIIQFYKTEKGIR